MMMTIKEFRVIRKHYCIVFTPSDKSTNMEKRIVDEILQIPEVVDVETFFFPIGEVYITVNMPHGEAAIRQQIEQILIREN